MELRKIFHEQNGRILLDTAEHHAFEKLKRYATEVCSWTEEVSEYGYFRCEMVVLSSSGRYIVKEWKPSPGYNWQEVIVYKVDAE